MSPEKWECAPIPVVIFFLLVPNSVYEIKLSFAILTINVDSINFMPIPKNFPFCRLVTTGSTGGYSLSTPIGVGHLLTDARLGTINHWLKLLLCSS